MRVRCFSFVVVFLLARGVHSPAVGGFAALRMRQVKPLFLLWEKWDVFILQLVFLPARLGPQPSRGGGGGATAAGCTHRGTPQNIF